MRAVIAVVLACSAAVAINLPIRPGHAQPSQTDLDHARDLYIAAETAMTEARFADAARDYALALELSRDPALLFKLGAASEKAGNCEVAVDYYRRYLREGKPAAEFVTLTRERIQACGADPDAGSGSGSAVDTAGSDAGGAGSGSAAPPPPLPQAKHRAAWLLVGGAIAAATAGAVLAYSANASERDVEDLYAGLNGQPPTFDASTRKHFDDLVDEGTRYQTLSWVSFGAAAVLGGLAAWRFVTDQDSRVEVAPTASPTGAGVRATLRF